jgi:hypothetical protein
MAKLNITAEQIQSTTNMLKSTAAAEDWTAEGSDDLYPSAKAVTNLVTTTTNAIIEACENASGGAEFPVGSIIIMGPDPASATGAPINPNGKIEGEWTLIDKSFKYGITDIGPPNSFSSSESGISISGETAIRTDHSLLIKLGVASANDITISTSQSSVLLVSLNLARLGVNQLSSASTRGIAFASSTNASAAGAAVCYDIQKDGKVYLNDVVNSGSSTLTLKKNMYMYINAIIPINHIDMIDSFCDKFYWQRTE